jgi:adenosylmethionine-8-amino-7-oxononanoate aminotransferase
MFENCVGPRVTASGVDFVDTTGGGHTQVLSNNQSALSAKLSRFAGTFAWTSSGRHFNNQWQDRLAARIRDQLDESNLFVYFTSGGTEAFEIAIQLAYHIQDDRGQPHRRRIVGSEYSYHGMSIAALSAGYHPVHRNRIGHALFDWPHISVDGLGCRGKRGREVSGDDIALRAAAATIVEPVGGTTTGALSRPAGYLESLARKTHDAGALFLADEVVTGFGRLGRSLAMPPGLADITIAGKLLAGGVAPLCAVIVHERLASELAACDRAPPLRLTFSGNQLACAAGELLQETVDELDVISSVASRGVKLRTLLKSSLADGFIVRGEGLLCGVEWRVPPGQGAFAAATTSRMASEQRCIVMPGFRAEHDYDRVFITVTPALDSSLDDLSVIANATSKLLATINRGTDV